MFGRKVELATREAVVTGQQQQVQHGSDYQVQMPTAVSLAAKIVPSQQGKAAQVTETQTGSFAGQLQTASRTEETAQLSLASMETANVSQVTNYRKEADWTPGSVTSKTAQAVTTSELRSVQVEQIQTVEEEGQLIVQKTVLADSTLSRLYTRPKFYNPRNPLKNSLPGRPNPPVRLPRQSNGPSKYPKSCPAFVNPH